MSKLAVCAMLCVAAMLVGGVASAAVLGYDSMGFESPTFYPGPLNIQDGWVGMGGGGGFEPLVVTAPDPVIGEQAVRLEVPDVQGAYSEMDIALPGGPMGVMGRIVTVSFDIFREQQNQNMWWWWWDAGNPTYGLQWDLSQATHPFGWNAGAGQTPTIFGQYVNLTMVWDFTNMTTTSWYGATVVDNAIPMPGDITGFSGWTIVLGHDAADGTGGDTVWIDNFKIGVVPEPAAISVIGLGLAGLAIRFRRR
jgi:hypothetical protein